MMNEAQEQRERQEVKHTPGPWRVNRRASTCVEDEQGRTIASTATVASNRPGEAERLHEENLANASLIAASPTMLETLKEADRLLGYFHWDSSMGRKDKFEMVQKIRAAIAAAEGKQS